MVRCLVVASMLVGALALQSPAPAGAQTPNSADRLVMWLTCPDFASLSDAELDTWRERGVGGFVCMVRHLRGMGGSQDFTGDAGNSLSGTKYDLQRKLRDSNIVARMQARGMKAYLGAYLLNYYNTSTPLAKWFDDAGWANLVLPKMSDLAAAARLLGFSGLAFDQELYAQTGGVKKASWIWSHPGNTRPESEVRAKAKERGQELMRTLLSKFPGIELLTYDARFPETWSEVVQQEVNRKPAANTRRLDIDFWDGLSSVDGYGALRFLDHTFYKMPHLGTWDTALQYHYNSLYALLSRRMSNWQQAWRRFSVSPFAWINPGPSTASWDNARPPQYVATQLAAFRRWGMDGEFANFVYGTFRKFNYAPYADAMRAATVPGIVDSTAPTLTVGEPELSDTTASVAGTAHDDMAVRAVHWSNDRGGSGVAELTWVRTSGSYKSGFDWETRWAIPEIALEPGVNLITVTVEDIKGLTTSHTLTIGEEPLPDPPLPDEPLPDLPLLDEPLPDLPPPDPPADPPLLAEQAPDPSGQ